MKKGFFLSVLISSYTSFFALNAAELKAINFTQKGEVSELEFVLDSNDVEANKFQIKEDKQIIVDFSGTMSSEKAMRALDTSQFSGGVVFVKAYKKPKSEKDTRVAIQLRDNVRSALVRKPNRIVLQIENRYGVFSQKKAEGAQSLEEKQSEDTSGLAKFNVPKSEMIEDILENLTLSGRKKYIGKKISMNLKSVKPDDILKMIADTSGFNMIVTEDVKKLEPISLNLSNVPWDQALDTVLDMNKLTAKKNGMILLVTTYETANKERELEKKAKELTQGQEPAVTKLFPISYADINDLKAILLEYLSDGSTGAKKGKISVDKRTNSIIVKDTSEVIERMKKIVELLDAQTPQVLIESKIVEVNERYTKEIGLDKGLAFGYDPFSELGTAATASSGSFSFSTAPASSRSLFGLSVTRFHRLTGLDFTLNLMESEAKGKVISSPKVVTKNNTPALITQNETTYFKEETTTPGVGGAAATTTAVYKSQDTKLELAVTPQITNEGSISLEVDLKKDSVTTAQVNAPNDLVKRQVKTHVLVDNGSTVVIGGIFSFSHTESHSGVPFLKDIPFLGWLFRTKFNPDTIKKELIIFLTPRIINQEEAGLIDKG